MNVFFIKPGYASTSFPHQYAVLSAYIKTLGHKTKFYDASLLQEAPELVLSKIDLGDTDVIGISALSGWHGWIRDFIKLVNNNFPHIKVIAGGHHISGLKDLALEHINADYGVVGEGEIPLGKTLSNIDNTEEIKKIPGVIYKENGEYKQTPFPLERITSLDSLPFPDYDLVKPEDYFHVYRGASVARRRYRNIQTITSRGCPYECTFCATNSTWQRKMSFLSSERVINEIKLLVENYGIREIWFGDDGFTANKKRAIEICEKMISEKINIPWRLPNGVRLDSLDDNLVSLMKRAGCYMTGIGIETGSPEMMVKIKKHLKLEIVEEKTRLLRKHGIMTSGFYIFGFPGETEKTLDETRNFILSSSSPRMQISIYEPYPGSESFNEIFQSHDRDKFRKNVKKYLYEGIIPEIKREVSLEHIQKLFSNTILKFYLKPSVIFSLIINFRLRQLFDIVNHDQVKKVLSFFIPKRKV